MYTQKTSGIGNSKITPESTGKSGTPAKTAPTAAAVKAPSAAPPSPEGSSAVPRSISSLISAAGLPADKLSASIISFARFFSLPIKPELMADIRRQALSPKMTMLPETIAKTREASTGRPAFSLAAAAAQDKGVELSPKGLEAFAEAVDPDRHKRGSGERHSHKRQQKKENAIHGPLSASDLKAMILESAEKDPLLALLNRLPGKNGQRWIVLPFTVSESGREFRVSLRILLDRDVRHMVLDIAESAQDQHGKTERRWVFVPTGASMSRLNLYLQPELPPSARDLLARQLSQAMGIPPDCISVNNLADPFPCEADSGNEPLYAVNEAV